MPLMSVCLSLSVCQLSFRESVWFLLLLLGCSLKIYVTDVCCSKVLDLLEFEVYDGLNFAFAYTRNYLS